MGADQQFCLRWNNFHTNITSAFESLRDDEDFVDITLACEGKQIKAHKMVLSACSPYFRCLLKGNPCQHPIVFLKDVTYANLVSILDFMYHGEVNVSHNELATFLKTAEALKVRGLAEDDKKRDSDCLDAGSPVRDGVDGSPRVDDSIADTHLSESPPCKRQRRKSSNSAHSAEDTNETVLSDLRDSSVKNEPHDFNDEDDLMSHNVDVSDIKADGCVSEENDRTYASSESVSLGRNQAAMHQLQESFGSFLPGMSQSPGFLSHSSTDMSRSTFSIDGVQGIPHGLSGLPGTSMSQTGASQDGSQGSWFGRRTCKLCGRTLSSKYALQVHMRDVHRQDRRIYSCSICEKDYGSQNSYRVHMSLKHRYVNQESLGCTSFKESGSSALSALTLSSANNAIHPSVHNIFNNRVKQSSYSVAMHRLHQPKGSSAGGGIPEEESVSSNVPTSQNQSFRPISNSSLDIIPLKSVHRS